MSEAQALLERQARWQKARRAMSWPEKIRMAEGVRESILQLQRLQKAVSDGPEGTQRCNEPPLTELVTVRQP